MSKCKFYTRMERELVAFRHNPTTDERHVQYIGIFDLRSAQKFVLKKMQELTSSEIRDGEYYRYIWIDKPYRTICAVERLHYGVRENLMDDWCDDFSAAEDAAQHHEAEEASFHEDVCPYNYRPVTEELDDNEILDIFFEGDEDVFEKRLGCVPMTYERLIDPTWDVPESLSLELTQER